MHMFHHIMECGELEKWGEGGGGHKCQLSEKISTSMGFTCNHLIKMYYFHQNVLGAKFSIMKGGCKTWSTLKTFLLTYPSEFIEFSRIWWMITYWFLLYCINSDGAVVGLCRREYTWDKQS